MPNRLKVKRTYTPGVTPTADELGPHEFAVNWADGIVYVKTPSGTIQSITLGGGGSSSIVEATTAAGFPATGSASVLYVSRDQGRVYRWDSSGVYIEIGN